MDSVLMNREYDHTHGLLGIEMQTVLMIWHRDRLWVWDLLASKGRRSPSSRHNIPEGKTLSLLS